VKKASYFHFWYSFSIIELCAKGVVGWVCRLGHLCSCISMELSHPSSGMSCRTAIPFQSEIPGVDGSPLETSRKCSYYLPNVRGGAFNCLAKPAGADPLLHLAR
jgi:hypothetical protein